MRSRLGHAPRRFTLAAFVLYALSGCGQDAIHAGPPFMPPGVTSTAAASPTPRASVAPGATATPIPNTTAAASSTPAPASTGALSAAQVTTSLQGVQSYYATLPHTDPYTDEKAVAAQMVASGAFTAASVTPGGITATLPDGSLALVFADHPESLVNGATAPAAAVSRTSAASSRVRSASNALSAPSPHELAFLYNDVDTNTFSPSYDQAWQAAFTSRGFVAPNYGVDAESVSLENMIALGGSGHPLDLLSIETHGMVASTTAPYTGPPYQFYFESTTPVNAATKATYAADLASKEVAYSLFLTTSPGNGLTIPNYAFTPFWLVTKVNFNPGAIVVLGSCFSSSPLIQSSNDGYFAFGGVGRLFGWTKEVVNQDFYESYSFLYDRMLGEANPVVTGLDALATQRVPPQRSFPADAIFDQMGMETRDGPQFGKKNELYTLSNLPPSQPPNADNLISPPLADGASARLMEDPLGTTPVEESSLPSISRMEIVEGSSGGVLTIRGAFPTAPGTGTIQDLNGTNPLTITSWTSDTIMATLPTAGVGSFGFVQVTDASGVPSNMVPITHWNGSVNFSESDSLPTLFGTTGGGTASDSASFNVDIRADVHQVVPSVDASPQAQNFVFTGPQGDSNGALTSFTGNYTSDEATPRAVTLSPAQPPPPMPMATPPFHKTPGFDFGAVAGQPAFCNDGTFGPSTDATNVFCPELGFLDQGGIYCTDDPDNYASLCPSVALSPYADFGSATEGAGGLIQLTLDPNTSMISVSTVGASFSGESFPNTTGDHPSTASVTASFGSPLYPPDPAKTTSTIGRGAGPRI